jgi:hypothetical protein
MNLQDTQFTYNDTFSRLYLNILDTQMHYLFHIPSVRLKPLLPEMPSTRPLRRSIFHL